MSTLVPSLNQSTDVDIPAFYAGRSIFLTGGTGFLGKVILEKLLRSCADVKRVFILVRGKGSQSPTDRINELFAGSLFEPLHKEQPSFLSKVVAINGELTLEGLGMSQEDTQTLIDEVSIVIHSAATVKFTEKIKLAVDLNVLVVRRMMALAREMKQLVCFMHISTAYAHTNRQFIEERVYAPSIDPQKLIDLTDIIDDEMAESLTPHFLGQRPNSYTFTKSIAEFIVASESKGLPSIIIRPSIVSSIWKEPLPGWVDNFNGPAGVAFAVGSGAARVFSADVDKAADVIPVDVVANYVIASAWYSTTKLYANGCVETPVINCAIGNHNPGTWGHYEIALPKAFTKYPMETKTIRRVKFRAIPSKNSKELAIFRYLQHTIPAKFYDIVLRLTFQKPIVVRLFAKMERSFNELKFFTSNQWQWEKKRSDDIMAAMNQSDRVTFSLDVRTLHWPTYIENMCIGIKKYMLRESIDDLTRARSIQRRHFAFSMIVKLLFYFLLYKFVVPFLRSRGMSKSLWIASAALYYFLARKL